MDRLTRCFSGHHREIIYFFGQKVGTSGLNLIDDMARCKDAVDCTLSPTRQPLFMFAEFTFFGLGLRSTLERRFLVLDQF